MKCKLREFKKSDFYKKGNMGGVGVREVIKS